MPYPTAQIPEFLRRVLAKIPATNTRNLWLLTGGLVVWHNLWVHYTTQHNVTMLVFLLLCWWGALTCMEDRLDDLNPSPTWPSAVAGTILLLWCLLRSSLIYDWDAAFNILPPLEMLSLALLCRPIRRLGEFWQQLLIMAMVPMYIILSRYHPERQLSELNANLAAFWLQSLGLDAHSRERMVYAGAKVVRVAGVCNGFEQIAQVASIAVIFLLAFPLRKLLHKLFLLVMAFVIGIAINSVRISLLTLLATPVNHSRVTDNWWFDFFHEGEGSLVFSAVAVTVFAMLYLKILDRELGPPPSSMAPRLENGDS